MEEDPKKIEAMLQLKEVTDAVASLMIDKNSEEPEASQSEVVYPCPKSKSRQKLTLIFVIRQ